MGTSRTMQKAERLRFAVTSALLLSNNNDLRLDQSATYDVKGILYDDCRHWTQRLDHSQA